MTSATTSKKRKHSQKKSTLKKSRRKSSQIEAWSPTAEILLNPILMSEGLSRALADGDQEAFLEILQGWIAALNLRFTMDELEKMTGVSRRALYNLTKADANPTVETILSLARAAKNVA